MIDDGWRTESAIRAAPTGWDVLAQLCQTLDVRFIDNCVFPRYRWTPFLAPCVGRIDHDRLRHTAGIIAPVERKICALVTCAITKMSVAPYNPTCQSLRVGVDQ